jgi:flagellar basal body-associated protein FliL
MEQYKNCGIPVGVAVVIAISATVVGAFFWFKNQSKTLCTPCTAELVDAAKNGNPAAQAALMNISAGAYDAGGSLGAVVGVLIMISIIAIISWLWNKSEKKLPFLERGQQAFQNFANQRLRGR